MTDVDKIEKCANCDCRLNPGGRGSKTLGKRFCMRRECQAVKQRHYRATVRGVEPRIEERPCFCCGAALAPRMARITDSEVGRWCSRGNCQRDRALRLRVTREIASGSTSLDTMRLVARLFREMHQRRRTSCSGCGRPDAVPGYPHPTPDHSEACRVTGTFPVTPADLPFAWPEEYPS